MAVELIVLPEQSVVLSDDADQVLDIDYEDGSLTDVPLLLTVREDPSYPRTTTVVNDDQRQEVGEDLADWEVVFTSTTTTTPATGYAAAVVVTRANAALLGPGKLRYVVEISRTDSGNVSPVVPPTWVSVRAAASRP